MPGWLSNWLTRHQHPASLALHLVGIPLTILAVAVAGLQLTQGRWDLWWRPVVLLALGYFLQWLGHAVEGNDMGEIILLKRVLNRPYIAVAPRWNNKPKTRAADN
jgi:hypothetical protein